MPGNALHVNATVQCIHGGVATIVPSQTRVLAGGQPVATISDLVTVAGCTFQVSGAPQPCVKVQWLNVSGRCMVMGQPMALATVGTGGGICQSAAQVPQGAPIIAVVQPRVVGA